MHSYDLFSRDTKAFIYGAQTAAVQRMLDFDYLCRKDEPSVVGHDHTVPWWLREILLGHT